MWWRECLLGWLSLRPSFGCPTSFFISGKCGLGWIISLFGICVRNHKHLHISSCQPRDNRKKYRNWSLSDFGVSSSCVFRLPGEVGAELINFFGRRSLSGWSQNDPPVGYFCDPLSATPNVPHAHTGCTCTCHWLHVKNLQNKRLLAKPHLCHTCRF